MSQKRWWIVSILAMVAVIGVGAVVALSAFRGNRVFSNVYGDSGALEVYGMSAGRHSPARFQGDGKTATVQLGELTARVTTEQIEIPGGRIIAIPPTCKRVELRESRNEMVVLLDGIEIGQ
jgi:hypothetical protein